MRVCGIYKILNKINGKVYVGKTSRDIRERWKNHRYCLRNNKKLPNLYLQNAWNKHGEDNFEFFILEECNIEKLKEREEYWINKLESCNSKKGYNLKLIFEGIEYYSKKTKQKMSNSRIGKKLSIEHKENISKANKGKHFQSEKTKQNISEANRGERNKNSKLTLNIVNEIRIKYVPKKYTLKMLSKEYNIGITAIFKIIKNKTWKE